MAWSTPQKSVSWEDESTDSVGSKQQKTERTAKTGSILTSRARRHAEAIQLYREEQKEAIRTYQEQEKELLGKLSAIEAQKKAELKEIQQSVLRVKQSPKQVPKPDKEKLPIIRQEIDSIKQENDSLRVRNDKLKKNCRNLRINNKRLEKSQSGNIPYFKKLEAHHKKVKEQNERLVKMEQELALEMKEVQKEVELFTARSLSEHKLRVRFHRGIKKMVKRSEESKDTGAIMKVYGYVDGMEQQYGTKMDAKIEQIEKDRVSKVGTIEKGLVPTPTCSKRKKVRQRSPAKSRNLQLTRSQ